MLESAGPEHATPVKTSSSSLASLILTTCQSLFNFFRTAIEADGQRQSRLTPGGLQTPTPFIEMHSWFPVPASIPAMLSMRT